MRLRETSPRRKTRTKRSRFMAKEEPTFWQNVWAWLKRFARWVYAPLFAILVVVVVFILVAFGVKNLQIGGLLGKLFGKEDDPKGKKAIDVANSVPENRVDENGVIIKPGEPDSTGQTQAVVVPIEEPGLFDDPGKIKVMPPGETEPTEVILPDGVKAKDVDKVVIIKPDVYAITIRDSSKVSAQDVDDLLSKYGGT
jgi:hypothetical protein